LMPWARLLGMRAMATRHLTLVENKPRLSWLRSGWRVHFLYERLAPFAHRIVCVSDAVRESMKTCVPENKLIVIRNWIPRLPEPRTSDRSTMPLRLLFVGRLIELKGAHLLLDAMRHLAKKRGPAMASLVIVGEGDERAALEIAAQGLDVTFAGFHKDPSQFYREADVFINPSLGPEGLPLVSLDAMSYGLPCVFSNLPVHREITGNGQAALLFERGDAGDLARALEYLIDSPQSVTNYGQVARQIAGEMFTADFARRRYLEELNLLTAQ
jgi:glycosyltransferase involved in cell wall biosynthesis